jgi:hypothetical protein
VLLGDSGFALTVEYRFHHLSNASIYSPNAGINTHVFSLGASMFF